MCRPAVRDTGRGRSSTAAIVLTEMFQEEWMAMNWARAYEERLRARGWEDVLGVRRTLS